MIPFLTSRSYRRFYQEVELPKEDLLSMVEAARLSPSSRNMQPIKFHLTNERQLNQELFPLLAWAGYLKEGATPQEGERPSAYITLLHDKSIAEGYSCDHGIFSQSILLRAAELGWGGVIIASIKRRELRELLQLPDHLEPILVIALGKPKERVVIEEAVDGDIKYWRDEEGVHHVPKRSIKELVWRESYQKQ